LMPRGAVGFSGEDFRILELRVLGWRGKRVSVRVFLCAGEGLVWHERVGVVVRMFWRARQLARRAAVAD
jgi:hypothetical protein